MAGCELRKRLQVFHDGRDVRELAHIDLLALGVVDHGGQERVRQSDDIA